MGKHKKPAAIGRFEAPTAKYPHGRKYGKNGWCKVRAPKSKDTDDQRAKRDERNTSKLRWPATICLQLLTYCYRENDDDDQRAKRDADNEARKKKNDDEEDAEKREQANFDRTKAQDDDIVG